MSTTAVDHIAEVGQEQQPHRALSPPSSPQLEELTDAPTGERTGESPVAAASTNGPRVTGKIQLSQAGECATAPTHRPQPRKSTTAIRPIQSRRAYGNAFSTSTSNGDGSGAVSTAAGGGGTRRAFPLSPVAKQAQKKHSSAFNTTTSAAGAVAATHEAPQHVDPVVNGSAEKAESIALAPVECVVARTTDLQPVSSGSSVIRTPAAAATADADATSATVTATPAPKRAAPHVPQQIIGRPSTGGQRTARPVHPNSSRNVTSTPARPAATANPSSHEAAVYRAAVAPRLAPASPSSVATRSQAPQQTQARRRAGPAVGAQRNHVATNPATQRSVIRSSNGVPASYTGVNGNQTTAAGAAGVATTAEGAGTATLSSPTGISGMQSLTRPSEAYKVSLKPTRQQRLITQNARYPHKIVNCFSTKYPLIRRIAHELDFEVQESEEDFNAYQFNLCWSDTVLPLTKLVRLGNWQRSNHFPSMYLLCRKGHLGTTLGRLRRHLPTHYAFYPHTWSMRTERVTFQRYYTALRQKRLVKYFIMKPNSGCQGRGIVVTRDPLNAMEDVDNYIVQEYVHRPLLLEDKKFDLRIYILLTSIREPSIFMFNDGLVRVCTECYEPPNDQNAKNACKHLTNYAVNKHSADYVFNTDVDHGDVGNKRNFRFLNRWLEKEGHSSQQFWDDVGFIIVKTILTAQPQIAQVYNSCFPRYNEGYTCFEVLGFDVLIDSKMKPWLMEVNHTPSFATDTPLDLDIKSKLLREVWDIVDCKATDQQRDRIREREEFARRNMPPWVANHPIYSASLAQQTSTRSGDYSSARDNVNTTARLEGGSPTPRTSFVVSPTTATADGEAAQFRKLVEAHRLNEDRKLRNFARIYPTKDENKAIVYETIRNLAQTEWSVPDSAAGFTINGHQYSQPSGFYTASGTPLTPAQQQQQDRIRKDLRDIASGNYTNTTGTGRNAFPVSRAVRGATKSASPIPAATHYTKMDAAGATGSAAASVANTPTAVAGGAAATGSTFSASGGHAGSAAGSHATSPTGTGHSSPSHTPAGMSMQSLAVASIPSTAGSPSAASAGASHYSSNSNNNAEAYRKIEQELKRARRRQSDASALATSPTAAAASGGANTAEPAEPTAASSGTDAETTASAPLTREAEGQKAVSTSTPTSKTSSATTRTKPVPPPLQTAATTVAAAAPEASAVSADSRNSRTRAGTPASSTKDASQGRSPLGNAPHPPSRRNPKSGTSPKGTTPTTPTHTALIEPTPEEFARLNQLQQDLDEAEAADPTPAIEDESFDLDE